MNTRRHTDDSAGFLVMSDDLRQLFSAILGAPYGKPLLDAATLMEQETPDLDKVVGAVYGVRAEYKKRCEKILSGKDETLRNSVNDNLERFQSVLDRLNRTLQKRAAEEARTNEPAADDTDRSTEPVMASASGTLPPAVIQSVVGDFGTLIQLINSARLTQANRIVVNLSDVAAGLNSARREFEIGGFEESPKRVQQLLSTMEKRIRDWENRARQRESQSAQMSMTERDKMRAEHHGVRNRYRMSQTHFRRLQTAMQDVLDSHLKGDKTLRKEEA